MVPVGEVLGPAANVIDVAFRLAIVFVPLCMIPDPKTSKAFTRLVVSMFTFLFPGPPKVPVVGRLKGMQPVVCDRVIGP
jgi:hypothetical protein